MIDITKQYQTRNGWEVKIFMTDNEGTFSVIGAYKQMNGWCPFSWTKEGKLLDGGTNYFDLVEVKPKFRYTRWVNIYKTGLNRKEPLGNFNYLTKATAIADRYFGAICIATVEVTITGTEGDGLS